jgi:hypothetical protein
MIFGETKVEPPKKIRVRDEVINLPAFPAQISLLL